MKECEIFVVLANIQRREMDAELQLRPEVNGHIDDLGIFYILLTVYHVMFPGK
jgi:hypothetical protein